MRQNSNKKGKFIIGKLGSKRTSVIALLIVIILTAIGINACGLNGTNEPDQNVGVEDAGETTTNDPSLGNERDNIPMVWKKGDIAEEVINPITGARAYEEMEADPEDPYGLLSRVIVEYKGKTTKMQPVSSILEFSPDGKYLLYIAQTKSENADGTYLYNVETGKTQELVPSVLREDPRFIPYPEDITWGDHTITYEKSGNWTLTYKEE